MEILRDAITTNSIFGSAGDVKNRHKMANPGRFSKPVSLGARYISNKVGVGAASSCDSGSGGGAARTVHSGALNEGLFTAVATG